MQSVIVHAVLSHGLQKTASQGASPSFSQPPLHLSRSSPAAQGCACPGFELRLVPPVKSSHQPKPVPALGAQPAPGVVAG